MHVLAADPRNSAIRHVSLAERGTKFQDLRLRNGIDPAGHFTQAKRISAVDAKGKVAITDPRSSRFEVYDTVGKVYTLFRTLNPDPKLAEFQFILDWPKMDAEKKREKYKEFACHELHFFLAHRDPEFFEAVVKPYIAHKKDKTFLDDYLTGARPRRLPRTVAVQPAEHGGEDPAGPADQGRARGDRRGMSRTGST